MDFTVVRAHLEFEAMEDIVLPLGAEINTFRGALGHALRRMVCRPDCREAKNCNGRQACAYARFFEPVWEDGPSGYREAPRPFVLRWAGSVPGGARKGELLRADLLVFDGDNAPWSDLRKAFDRVAADGLGPSRGRARLRTFAVGDMETLPLCLPAGNQTGPELERSARIRLHFVTPTELKSGGGVWTEPDFGVLTHRLVERLWALGTLYQGWQAGDWDYRELLDLGRSVRLLDWSWLHKEAERRSSRTGQRHSIGGFTGWAEYEGRVGPFLPLLEIGRWTGVGRQTVWGKGEIRLESVRWMGG